MDLQERMSCLQATELSLDLRLKCGPPAPSPFHNGVLPAALEEERVTELEEYARKLQAERRKIEVYRRELPLSVILLNDVIGDLKEEIARRRSDLTVAEKKQRVEGMMDWMSSSTVVSTSGDEEESGGATVHHGGVIDSSPPQRSQMGKNRRRWSPELHQSFVNALETLGGLKAATPNKVKDLMKVEGLTNDEIKSHLQKFRLRAQGLTASSSAPPNKAVAGSPTKERGTSDASVTPKKEKTGEVLQKGGRHKQYAGNRAGVGG